MPMTKAEENENQAVSRRQRLHARHTLETVTVGINFRQALDTGKHTKQTAELYGVLTALQRAPDFMIHRSPGITMLRRDVVNHSHASPVSKSSSVMKLSDDLPDRGYICSLLIDANTVFGIFIVRRAVISESRRMGQFIFVDTTYKTNDRRLPLVNIVGVNNESVFDENDKPATILMTAIWLREYSKAKDAVGADPDLQVPYLAKYRKESGKVVFTGRYYPLNYCFCAVRS
ncbi:hypothetical protein V1523DRAFT_433373 [Lipomyces doorenjongii]